MDLSSVRGSLWWILFWCPTQILLTRPGYSSLSCSECWLPTGSQLSIFFSKDCPLLIGMTSSGKVCTYPPPTYSQQPMTGWKQDTKYCHHCLKERQLISPSPLDQTNAKFWLEGIVQLFLLPPFCFILNCVEFFEKHFLNKSCAMIIEGISPKESELKESQDLSFIRTGEFVLNAHSLALPLEN